MRQKFTRWCASVDAHLRHVVGTGIDGSDTDIYGLFDAGMTARQAAREIISDARERY
jgi:hypothetical protein